MGSLRHIEIPVLVGVHCQSNKEILARTASTVSDGRFKHSRSSMISTPGMNEQNEHVRCAHVTHLFSTVLVLFKKKCGSLFLGSCWVGRMNTINAEISARKYHDFSDSYVIILKHKSLNKRLKSKRLGLNMDPGYLDFGWNNPPAFCHIISRSPVSRGPSLDKEPFPPAPAGNLF